MSCICVQDVSYAYSAEKQALLDVCFDAKKGELVGIVGPNGSGKTTLLGCISGCLKPQKGKVLVDGSNSAAMSAKEAAKRMALVRQQSAVEYGFTVGDIVLMGRNPHLLRWRGETSEDYKAANEALAAAGIADLKHRLAGTLSGGERQMMVLARALCQQAHIMLLDEPVAGLDIRHQISIMGTVRRLVKKRSLTAVCVLHDLNLALGYCDRIVMLGNGMVYASGLPEHVLTKENIERVYGIKVHLVEQIGRSFVLPDMG